MSAVEEMRALVFHGVGDLRVEQVPVPDPGPGEVLIEVEYAGVCGSELSSFTGHSTRRPPGRIFGHELTGRVAGGEAGGIEPGTPVVVDPLMTCGHCERCREGRTNICASRRLLGMQVDGGFAQYVAVRGENVVPTAGLDSRRAVLAEPLANAVHLVRRAGACLGRRVTIVGTGPIGLCVLTVFRAAGVGEVTVVEPDERRAALAEQEGAYVRDPAAAGGADIVVDAVGNDGARAVALECARPGATVMLLGLHTACSPLELNAAILAEVDLRTSWGYTAEDFRTALDLLRTREVSWLGDLVEQPLEEGAASFRILTESGPKPPKIVLRVGDD